jgi:hypothetical protein
MKAVAAQFRSHMIRFIAIMAPNGKVSRDAQPSKIVAWPEDRIHCRIAIATIPSKPNPKPDYDYED